MNADDTPYCADGCGRPATTERLDGMVGDTECVELVCESCRDAPAVETWVRIPGFDDTHEVSDLGRVRTLDRIVEAVDGPR